MADISYESLQSQIGEQQTQITSQRQIIQQQKIAGEKGIQSLRRVHPKTKPGVYFGQIQPRIEAVKGQIVELESAEKQLGVSETKLKEQETLLAERKAEGWKIREKDGEYEFYKVTQVPGSVGVGRPSGDFSVRITWRDYRTKPEGEIKTVRGLASNLESMQQQISERGGQVIEVESLGGGRQYRTPEMRTTTGGSFILWEAPPIVKDPKLLEQIGVYTAVYEKIPETAVGLKKKLPTPVEFAVARGVSREIFIASKIEKEKSESKFWKETIPEEAPEIHYLLGFAEKLQRENLRTAIVSGDERQIKLASEAAYKSLTFGEKEQYGTTFQPFKDEPVGQWRFYPGGIKYLKSLPESERKKILEEFDVRSELPKDISVVVFSQRAADIVVKLEAEARKKKGSIFGLSLKESAALYKKAEKQAVWELLSSKPEKFRELTFTGMPWFERVQYAPVQAFATTAIYPFTLGQMAVKYIRGAGALTDPLGRIRTGETLTGFDIAEQERRIRIGPSGLISTAVSEGIGIVTGREVGEFEKVKRSPIEAFLATGGEIAGLYVGGRVIHAGRVTFTKVAQRLKIPSVPLKYRPTILLRKSYWRTREFVGKGIRVKPEVVFRTEALPGGLSYAPGRTAFERVVSVKDAFKAGRVVTAKGEEVLVGVHTTSKLWLKPLALLRKGRESPGVSLAPFGEAAPRFLRITGKPPLTYEVRGISLLPQMRFPTAPLIYFKKLRDIPKAFRKSYERANLFIKESAPGVFIAPKLYAGGGEFEVIARGVARRLGVRYFTEIKGVTVPFPEFALIEKVTVSTTKNILKNMAVSSKRFLSLTSSYDIPATIPLITPSYLVSRLAIGLSYPSIPSIPSVTSVPSVPSIPSYPSIPSIPSVPSVPVIPPYKIPKLIPLPDTTYKLFGHTIGQGYHVYVKERHYFKGKKVKEGKMGRLSKRPLSKMNALSLGGMAVDNSAAATFEIKPVNAMAQEPLIKLKSFDEFQDKFYMKDSKYIEKPKHRIDTKGEVKGISALGWYAEKAKKAEKKRQVVARKPRARKQVDVFDMGTDDMLININKMFKGVFDFGF